MMPNAGAGSRRNAAYGKIPLSLADSGALSAMNRADAIVYLAIAAHVNSTDWSSAVGVPSIAGSTGLNERTVQRAIHRLVDLGVFQVERGGGRSRTNRYYLEINPGTDAAGVSPTKPRQHGAAVSVEKPRQLGAAVSVEKPRQVEAERVAECSEKGGTQVPPEQHEQQNSSSTPAAAAPAADRGVLQELTAVGIGEPTRSRLAALPGVTADLVRRSRERTQGKGTGALVREIEAAVEAKAAQEQRARERHDVSARAEAERSERREIEARQLRDQWEQVDGIIDRLGNDELARLKDEVMNAVTPEQRELWRQADPRASRTLKVAIVQKLGPRAGRLAAGPSAGSDR